MELQNSYARLPDALFSHVQPKPAARPALLAWNEGLADELGLGALGKDTEALARWFGGGPLPDALTPIALAYAGHQFGGFVPQLGDGRAVLLGEAIDRSGRRRDIQLKGSGRTPYSRGGDGRSWLGPVIREYLVSEAMHHLGVPTTRALAAVATGEVVYRDGALPGAVFTRVASSHLRIGTFQYLLVRDKTDALRELADYAIERHDPDVRDAPDRYAAFFARVASRQADLVAQWMALGFIHGVMNTDNTSIAGETIDYGPCAFMDEFRHDKVFSSIDQFGRYAWGNQPPIAQWNLARLADCLLPLGASREALEGALADFGTRYESSWLDLMRGKLGFEGQDDDDAELAEQWLAHLEDNGLDYTLSFRELAERVDAADEPPRFGEFEVRWRERVLRSGREPGAIRAAMNAVNPLFIPRNHRVEQAIDEAVSGDLAMFTELGAVLSQPFEEQAGFERYAEPPEPAERVTRTFCGT